MISHTSEVVQLLSNEQHVMILDGSGVPAIVHHYSLPYPVIKHLNYIKVVETERVLKVPKHQQDFRFPSSAPEAQPIYAHTKLGFDTYGDQALVWNIGLKASNGFSIPSTAVIDSCYVLIDESLVKQRAPMETFGREAYLRHRYNNHILV